MLLEWDLSGVYLWSTARELDSFGVVFDRRGTEENPFPISPSRREIREDLEKLIGEKKVLGFARDPAILDGAEFDPTIVKKKGKGSRFLVRKVPSRAKLLRLWANIFENAISPSALIEALSAKTLEFEHREVLLLFGRGRIIYDASIFQGDESVGELTLSFAPLEGSALARLLRLKDSGLRVVHIEHIHLTAQRSGYASALFRHYEQLFRDLGFHQFRLSASLSVGKYYWAKEGFDFSDVSEVARRRKQLRALVEERRLPVSQTEVERLDHACDFARFKRELKIPVYRDAEGYYSLKPDDRFREEVFLPLGKAFLLCSAPWEGHKLITAPGTTERATSAVSFR